MDITYYIILAVILLLLVLIYKKMKKKKNPTFERSVPTIEDTAGPFLMNVGLVNDLGDGFVSATGLIERGRIHLNDKVSVASGRGIFSSFVTELVVDEKKVEEAKAGEVLTIKIDKMTATDVGAGDSIYVNTSLF